MGEDASIPTFQVALFMLERMGLKKKKKKTFKMRRVGKNWSGDRQLQHAKPYRFVNSKSVLPEVFCYLLQQM